MNKLKNPYSRNRMSFKEKFNKKFTEIIVPYIKKIRMDENWRDSRFIPEVLKSARITVKGWEREKISTSELPQGIDLDLISVVAAEYIPIENVNQLNKGLKKLVEDYPYRFQHGQADRIDEFCSAVKTSIHGGRWSNFGYIDFSKQKGISDFVKNVHIHGTHLSSSSIILQFDINPSEKFNSRFKKLIESDIKEGHTFDLKFKKIFKFWGGKSLSYDIVKNQMVEDLILELKWQTMKEISKYFSLYFTNNKLIPPGIEVYKLDQTSCILNKSENEKRNSFWNSIGMDTPLSDISKNGFWQLFTEGSKPHFIDNSLKITCNTNIEEESDFHSFEFQIISMLEELSRLLLPIMVMREYSVDISKKIAEQQNKTFSSLKKEKTKYNKLINIRYGLERNLQILKRFKNEIGENYFNKVQSQINNLFEFEPSNPRYLNISTTKMIVENTKYNIDKTYEHSQHFAKMIDDTAKLLEIKTNNSLRKRSFELSIITVVLSLAATVFAGFSLFYQLSIRNQIKITSFFKPITDLYHYFF